MSNVLNPSEDLTKRAEDGFYQLFSTNQFEIGIRFTKKESISGIDDILINDFLTEVLRKKPEVATVLLIRLPDGGYSIKTAISID